MQTRFDWGRLIMTLILISGALLSFVLDWSSNHLLNPDWHPHARFHGALLLFLLSGVSLAGVWMLWRKSKEPEVAMKLCAFISGSFSSRFFYVTFLLPA